MGMIVSVYRDADGCTNGVSAYVTRLCVVNVDGPFEPDETMPAAILQSHVRGCLRIVPENPPGSGPRHVMFGGNYAATSDSRFSEACAAILGHGFYGAVAIHDRIE